MNLKYSLLFFILLALSYGCSQSPVSGHIMLNDSKIHKMVYLIDPVNFGSLVSSFEGKVIDSASINDQGNFAFKQVPQTGDQEKMYLLVLHQQQEQYPNKLNNDQPETGNYIPFIYKPGHQIAIQSDANQFLKRAAIQSNIEGNRAILALIKQRLTAFDTYLAHHSQVDEENLIDYEKAIYNYQSDLLESVANAQNIWVYALALRWASVEGDYERIPELVKQTCHDMHNLQPDHLWTAQVCQKLSVLPLSIGDTIPDFEMPRVQGDTTTLNQLLGSKLTIIDLWASWCAPCRKEHRNTLVPLWDTYHTQGFQIIGYALDSSHKGWEQAIIKDGANRWPHASHLQGDVSPFLDLLKISTIPSNYIVNQDGVILAKNLHGEALETWVAAYMNK